MMTRNLDRMQTPPTEEEAAAILAAVEALWPKPVAAPPERAPRVRPWRFSGRWWTAPTPLRRARPGF
jgi:hypothetical protein